jgi:sterol desaturase/sphingolipid hydroxylase (fatty acid hydroxylase superfamily)
MFNKIRIAIQNDLETTEENRTFGSGWISGFIALTFSFSGFLLLLSMQYPTIFSSDMLQQFHSSTLFTKFTQGTLFVGFFFSCLNLILRRNKILGFISIVIVLITTTLGEIGSFSTINSIDKHITFGLDWFVLNMMLTGILFIPLEKLFGRLSKQPLFREEYKEDLFYFLISSIFVQTLTFLTLTPSLTILTYTTQFNHFRDIISSQYLIFQVIEIMFLTDLVQYWFHRAFHQIPFLWRFHAVHHSAKQMDWLAGSRMHLFEIIGLRSMTVIPMYVLGFSESSLHIYILFVYLNATYLHSNIRFNIEFLKSFIATPRFHHWHHGIEKEAINVNFSIHFPWLDKLFGTYYMPPNKWPKGYGINKHPVPNGYLKQFLYPLKFSNKSK